jgi:hypothetical protein
MSARAKSRSPARRSRLPGAEPIGPEGHEAKRVATGKRSDERLREEPVAGAAEPLARR